MTMLLGIVVCLLLGTPLSHLPGADAAVFEGKVKTATPWEYLSK